MKTETKVEGKKQKRILKVLFIILLIIALIPLGWYVYVLALVSNMAEIRIEGIVTVDFETGRLLVTGIQVIDDEGVLTSAPIDRILDAEELAEYKSYVKDFWKHVYIHRPDYRGYLIMLPWMISADERMYWDLTVTQKNGNKYGISGSHAYPKDWPEFIARTNALIGFDYLSDDTQGLPLK